MNSTMYIISKRYQELRNLISQIDGVEIDELMQSEAENRRIQSVINEFLKTAVNGMENPTEN